MRKRQKLDPRFYDANGQLYPDRFAFEVKHLTSDKWLPVVGVPDDTPDTLRTQLRAQGQEWMLGMREWRVVPI